MEWSSMQRSEGNFVESALSFHFYLRSRDQTRVHSDLGIKHPYQLNHLLIFVFPEGALGNGLDVEVSAYKKRGEKAPRAQQP